MGGNFLRSKSKLVVVKGTLNAAEYVDMLSRALLPFIEDHHPEGCIFQQDNAPAHTAQHTRDFFMESGTTDMVWPPRSPDLNCIENAWGELVCALYRNGRQFDSEEDLCEALFYEWDNLQLSYIRKLITSMPNRAHECLVRKGRTTSY